MNRPIWIVVDNGEVFEGHQGHWAETFFSNATRAEIKRVLDDGVLFEPVTYEMREMTDSEVASHPGLGAFCDCLRDRYGDC